MEPTLSTQINENSLRFKTSLDHIIEKYSKTRHHAGIEVDINRVKVTTLGQYMERSRKMLNMIVSKSLTDLDEDSLSGQSVTGNSQLDFTFISGGADRTCNSTSKSAMENNEVTQSSFDESSRNLCEGEHLPEDQDEELQMSLSSHGSSLVELYPSMVSRIGRACRLQHVSEAASSVLRRYQRWRKQSKRGSLNSTLHVTQRNTKRKPKMKPSSKVKLKESSNSPVRLETTPRRVLQTVTSLHDRQRQQPSPGKDASSSTRPVRVMDFSETAQVRNSPLNETFIVSEMFPRRHLQLGEHVFKNTSGPSPSSYGTSRSSKDTLLHLTKPSQSAEFSTYSREAQAVTRRPDVYSSSLRHSPLKTKVMNAFSRSPQAFSRGQEYSVDHCSTESVRPRSPPASLPSSPKRPLMQPVMLYPPSPQPQPAQGAGGHRRFRRHLSFDSSLSRSASYSPKKVDDEFVKLYHKHVCQNKSIFFNSLHCRFCARNSDASRGHSSSSLAALALSPHRSVLWKRHREMESNSCTKSKRHKTDMLMHYLSPYKLDQPRSAFAHSPRKHRAQPPAAHQEAWRRGHRHASAADLSVLGDSCEDTLVSGYSPR